MQNEKYQPVQRPCTSVFKSGENVTTTEAFTQVWITLINQLEQTKRISFENRD